MSECRDPVAIRAARAEERPAVVATVARLAQRLAAEAAAINQGRFLKG